MKTINRPTDKEGIVVIGLDSCDVDLVERWSKEGRIPFLAFLKESNVFSRLISTRSLFGDSPWPSFNAGVSPAKHAFYNHLQIKRGTTEIERVNAHHCRYLPFWSLLQDSAKKVVAFDVPKTFPIEGIDGIQISAWGEHYPLLKQPTSQVPDFASDIIARFGKYPHPREIIKPWSTWQERRIYKTLSSNLEKKLRATEYLMGVENWDLFMSVFSEVHYAGHQFYHCFDKEHWAHGSKAPYDIQNALPNLYTQLDSALSRLFSYVSEQTTFFVVSVHGLATNYSAN
ncbi:MAG: alkaline phosphatase family protein, partial [Thermodesulfobacteriota bacterium]